MKMAVLDGVGRITVVRLDALGDLILSVPFFINLRRAFPDAEITAVVRRYASGALIGSPYVDRVLIYPEGGSVFAKASFAAGLRRGRPDLVFSLSPVTESYLVAAAAGGAVSVSYWYSGRPLSGLIVRSLFRRSCMIDVEGMLARGERVPHEVLQTFRLLELVGVEPEEVAAEIFPGESSIRLAEEECGDERFVGLHLSPKWLTSGWSDSDLAGVVSAISGSRPEFRVMLTYGGHDERAIADRLRPLLGGCDPLIKGGMPFSDWAAFVSRCSAFVSTDTGALHCAAALGVPVAAVYEPSTFDHCSAQWAPWMVRSKILRKPDPAAAPAEISAAVGELLA